MSGTLDSLAWLLVAVLLLLALAASAIAVRRFLLERGGGTIECALRQLPGGSWRPGVASYRRDELHWFRALGIRLRPTSKFTRRSLAVVSRREVSAPEAGMLAPARAVVEVSTGSAASAGSRVELAMTAEALTGFLSWLEASPPSSHLEDIALSRTGLRSPPAPRGRVRARGEDGVRRTPENRRTPGNVNNYVPCVNHAISVIRCSGAPAPAAPGPRRRGG